MMEMKNMLIIPFNGIPDMIHNQRNFTLMIKVVNIVQVLLKKV